MTAGANRAANGAMVIGARFLTSGQRINPHMLATMDDSTVEKR
jgi:hypothetical protein